MKCQGKKARSDLEQYVNNDQEFCKIMQAQNHRNRMFWEHWTRLKKHTKFTQVCHISITEKQRQREKLERRLRGWAPHYLQKKWQIL